MVRCHMKRHAFTLTELLVVIVIIGMLASISLAALYSARGSAREASTKATIAKLDTIIQARYAEFFSRKMPITRNLKIPAGMIELQRVRWVPRDTLEELKIRTLREIIRMEMPDRIRDVTWPRSSASTDPLVVIPTDMEAEVRLIAPFTFGDRTSQYWVNIHANVWSANPPTTPPNWPGGITRTALAKRYFRKALGSSWSAEYDSAECLYMTVASDPEDREQFHENEIGDFDGDGFPEFHDGWGHPIMFLRWAPGFQSDMQTRDANDPDPTNPGRLGDLVRVSGKYTRMANGVSFHLFPLIYSAGADGRFGVNQKSNWTVEFSRGDSINEVWTQGADIGEPVPVGHEEYGCHLDNITNHELGMN